MDSRKRLVFNDPESSTDPQSNDASGSSTQPISVASRQLAAQLQFIYDLGDSQGKEITSFKWLGFRTPPSMPRWYALGFAHGREAAKIGVSKFQPTPVDIPKDYSVGFQHGMEEFSKPEYVSTGTNT